MSLETISNKIDNLDYTLKELAEAVNSTNEATFVSIIVILTIFAVAIIASQAIYIKIIKKMQKQLINQNSEIQELKKQISDEENKK